MLSIANTSEAISASVGAYIAYLFSKSATFAISAFLSFIAFFLALSLNEIKIKPKYSKNSGLKYHLEKIKLVVSKLFIKNATIKWITLYGMSLGAVLWIFTWLLQVYFKFLNINLKWFGVLWTIFNLSVSFFALFAHSFEEKFGFLKSFLIIYIIPIFALVAIYFLSDYLIVALVLVLLFALSRALAIPIIQDFINKNSDPSYRATSLSVYNMFSRFGFIALSPLVGYFVDVYGLLQAFLLSAIFFAVLGVFLFLFAPTRI